jgi:acyl-CoA synthetase (AMP-forming)/AMP-acid ligase II
VVPATGSDAIELVSCGQPIGQTVVIVDPATRLPVRDGAVGEIWISGPNVGIGYWGRPEETARTFHNRLHGDETNWLATGDLGVYCDGELYVTGRIKDMIIVDGRNHYPHDVELTVERAHDAIRRHNVVAFAIPYELGERAVVLAERAKTVPLQGFDDTAVRHAVRAAVAEKHGLALHDIHIVAPDALPRTSSGKIARFACRDGYLAGALTARGSA